MTRKQLIAGLIAVTLIIASLRIGGIVDASPLVQASRTPRSTRERTRNPTATETNTPRPTRQRATREPTATDTRTPRPTREPSATDTNTPRPTRPDTRTPRSTKTPEATAEPSATDKPTRKPTKTGTPSAGVQRDDGSEGFGVLTSQLLILNPDRSGTANVTLKVYNAQGAVAFADSFKLVENGAKLVTLPASVGKEFLGSARITANRRVQALVLDSSGDGAANDSYEATSAASNALTLPFVRHLQLGKKSPFAVNSVIAIQNASSETADATITAYDAGGKEILAHPVTISPYASAYVNTTDLFPNTSFVGSARITSTQPLAAAEVLTGAQDTASLRALNSSDVGTRLVVPGIERKLGKKNRVNAWSDLFVRNEGAAPTDITVSYYSRTGQLKGKGTRSSVAAGGLARFNTGLDEFAALGKKFSGWATVASTQNAPLAVYSLASKSRGKQLVGIGALPRSRLNGSAVCGDVSVSVKETSVITMINSDSKDKAVVHVRLFAQVDGAHVAQLDIAVAPNGQRDLSSQNGLPANFQGLAILKTEGKNKSIAAMVTTQTVQGKRALGVSGYVCRP